jgi:hypothetical protein
MCVCVCLCIRFWPKTHAHKCTHAQQVNLPDDDTRALPDGPCGICDKDECYSEDMFVQCAACALTVHQGCYGCVSVCVCVFCVGVSVSVSVSLSLSLCMYVSINTVCVCGCACI